MLKNIKKYYDSHTLALKVKVENRFLFLIAHLWKNNFVYFFF